MSGWGMMRVDDSLTPWMKGKEEERRRGGGEEEGEGEIRCRVTKAAGIYVVSFVRRKLSKKMRIFLANREVEFMFYRSRGKPFKDAGL